MRDSRKENLQKESCFAEKEYPWYDANSNVQTHWPWCQDWSGLYEEETKE